MILVFFRATIPAHIITTLGRLSKLVVPNSDNLLPLFDIFTNLPTTELLPQLLNNFFYFYGDNFYFLNR